VGCFLDCFSFSLSLSLSLSRSSPCDASYGANDPPRRRTLKQDPSADSSIQSMMIEDPIGITEDEEHPAIGHVPLLTQKIRLSAVFFLFPPMCRQTSSRDSGLATNTSGLGTDSVTRTSREEKTNPTPERRHRRAS
jgi:hypothetical protein